MSQTKIYVGNLSYDATDADIESYFAQFGNITDVKMISDRETGRSKGFGFVSFDTADAAQAAIDGANNTEFMGRKLRVNIANDTGGSRSGGGRPRHSDNAW